MGRFLRLALPICGLMIVPAVVLVRLLGLSAPSDAPAPPEHKSVEHTPEAPSPECSEQATSANVAAFTTRNGAWGKVWQVVPRAVEKETGGRFELAVRYVLAGQDRQDESSVVAELRAGKLQGAMLSTDGLSAIDPAFAVLATTDVNSWDRLDAQRAALEGLLDARLAEQGLTRLAWVDFGLSRISSHGISLDNTSALEGSRVYFWPRVHGHPLVDPMEASGLPADGPWIEDIGMMTPTLILETTGLRAGLDHIHSLPVLAASGAVVFRKDALRCWLPEVRKVFDVASKFFVGSRIRNRDHDAWDRTYKRMTVSPKGTPRPAPSEPNVMEAWSRLRFTPSASPATRAALAADPTADALPPGASAP